MVYEHGSTTDTDLEEMSNEGKVLYCYLDESGDFDFGEKGSKYYFQSALVTDNPYPILQGLQLVKYKLYMRHLPLSKSHSNNDYFHATEDALTTRYEAYHELSCHIDAFRVYSISVYKRRTPPDKRDPRLFYQMVFENLIGKVIDSERVVSDFSHILVLTDRIPIQRHRRSVIGSLKRALSFALDGTNTKYTVAEMDSKSDFGLQAADYCTWAIHRAWVHSDVTYYTLIQDAFERTMAQYPSGMREYTE